MSKVFFMLIMTVPILSSGQSNGTLFDKLLYTRENESLPYRLLKPENPQAQKKFPLVIFLHGAGERGDDNEVQIRHITEIFLNTDNRGRYPCYVLAPQCPKNTSWAAHDRIGGSLVMRDHPSRVMALLLELIDKTAEEFSIDRSRIYVTGLSMGGYGAWELISRYPDRFAAAVPICGGGDPGRAKAISHIPLWAFHGSLDNVVTPGNSRQMIKALQDAGGKPGYTEYPDVGHDSWVYAYRDPYLLPWLFRHRLEKK